MNAHLRCRFVHYQVGLQSLHEEAVCHVGPGNRLSRTRSWVVVMQGNGALACACARARNIKSCDGAIRIAQEAVIREVSIDEISRDRPLGVVAFRESALACPCARARSIER